MLLNNYCVIKKSKKKIPGVKLNRNATYPTLWNAVKAILRKKIIAMYIL